MAERTDEKAAEAGRQSWTQLFYSAGARLVPLVVSASALLGFVAFAGAVIVWTRFFAVKVPPDQVVTAVPRGELVATGSSLLLLFGFFGVLTAIATYLIDRGGRATPGMARGLLIILGLEGITAIVIDAGGLTEEAIAPVAVFAGSLLIVLTLTLFDTFTSISDSLPPRNGERVEPRPRLAVPWIVDKLRGEDEAQEGKDESDSQGSRRQVLKEARKKAMQDKEADASRKLESVRSRAASPGGSGAVPTEAEAKAEDALRRAKEDLESLTAEEARGAVGWLKVRPNQLKFTGWGVTLSLVLIGAAILLSARLREEPWVAVSLGAATLLAIGLWRIAALSKETFLWFGLAAFISVPLFGTLTLMAQNLDDPQVQPLALIRSGDGPDEAIQGLYVTEGDDRVYFATVATEGCGEDIRDGSGRLLWVPKSEVVAMSVGPLQSVEDAARASLEMAAALTPAIETPRGPITLRGGLLEGAEPTAANAPAPAPRLENSGPAVRPTFGTGVTLDPEVAPPGEEVKLTMNTAGGNPEELGFGPARNLKTLRVGGVEATILKERTYRASQAEFVKTAQGSVLPLNKRGLYRETGRTYERIEPRFLGGERAYVKLSRRSGVKRSHRPKSGKGPAPNEDKEIPKDPRGGVYVEVRKAGGQWELVSGQKVELRKDDPVSLSRGLWRQAWGEKQIRFRVPENAPSGVVTVECEQLAGQPLLQVAEAGSDAS